MAATLVVGGSAQAQVSQEKYDAQYAGDAGSLLHLSYDDWAKFNAVINIERKGLNVDDLPMVDLGALRWAGGVQDVEVYFINEGAGYRNQLYYSVDSGASKEVIFDDVSSPLSILSNSNGPLRLGQGESLGSFEGNTFIDFFLKTNGKNNPNNPFLGFDAAQNPDNLQHVLGYSFGDYVLLAFEDIIGGGDKDYNDTVFVVKGVTDQPASVPEPTTVLGVLGAGALLVLRRR